MFKRLFASASLSVSIRSACLSAALLSGGARAQELKGLDVNDVAVLFPLDQNAQLVPNIPLSSPGTGTLIPLATYGQVLRAAKAAGIAAPFPTSIESPASWGVVAYRVDPCAPKGNNGPGGACTAELRLIAQPTSPTGSPSDTALHVLYDIESNKAEVFNAIVAMKAKAEALTLISTSGKPLGVHPSLDLANMNGSKEIPELHRNFIKTFAQPDRLKKITIMGLRGAFALDWLFLGGDVVDGQWTQGKIPNLQAGHDNFVEFDLRADPNPFMAPTIDKTISTAEFFVQGVNTPANARAILAEAAHRLESPEASNRNTADCLSCHSATTMRLHPVAEMPFYIKGITAKVPKGITGFPEPLSLQNNDLNWNLRALGYFNGRPTLAMRTVNEAARSADAINSHLGRSNPGPDCTQNEAEVVACFAKTSSPAGPQKSTEECLSLCQQN